MFSTLLYEIHVREADNDNIASGVVWALGEYFLFFLRSF